MPRKEESCIVYLQNVSIRDNVGDPYLPIRRGPCGSRKNLQNCISKRVTTRKAFSPSKRELSGVIGGINESPGSTVGETLGSRGRLARH